MTTKNRIVKHAKVRAGDLVPHELNPRTHSEAQRETLKALYEEIGFARSLLGYYLPDGRIKLIDGHLRQSLDPDMEVDVEVLDVTDEEARKLLLSIDPLAQLADYDNSTLDALRDTVATDNETIAALWSSLQARDEAVTAEIKKATKKKKDTAEGTPEVFSLLIECEDEQQQVKLLRLFKRQGLKVKAITS